MSKLPSDRDIGNSPAPVPNYCSFFHLLGSTSIPLSSANVVKKEIPREAQVRRRNPVVKNGVMSSLHNPVKENMGFFQYISKQH